LDIDQKAIGVASLNHRELADGLLLTVAQINRMQGPEPVPIGARIARAYGPRQHLLQQETGSLRHNSELIWPSGSSRAMPPCWLVVNQ
jgi:hypothetical protein